MEEILHGQFNYLQSHRLNLSGPIFFEIWFYDARMFFDGRLMEIVLTIIFRPIFDIGE